MFGFSAIASSGRYEPFICLASGEREERRSAQTQIPFPPLGSPTRQRYIEAAAAAKKTATRCAWGRALGLHHTYLLIVEQLAHRSHRLLPLMPAAAIAAASFSLRSRSSLRIQKVQACEKKNACPQNKHCNISTPKRKRNHMKCGPSTAPLRLLLYRAANRFPQIFPAAAD
jgi:hypothetical protein